MELKTTWGRVAEATRGKLVRGQAEDPFGSLSTDTRALAPEQAFWALKGLRFDAHDFLDRRLEVAAFGVFEQVLAPGQAVGFPAHTENGHRLENRTDAPAVYLEIGTRAVRDEVTYPDANLRLVKEESGAKRSFFHKDGTPY